MHFDFCVAFTTDFYAQVVKGLRLSCGAFSFIIFYIFDSCYNVPMIYLVSGPDWFRAKQYIDKLIREYEAKQCRVVSVSTDDENWLETVLQYAKQDSLFSEQNCVVLSIEAQKKDGSEDLSEEELQSAKDKKQNLQAIIKAFSHANQELVIWNRGRKMALAGKGAKTQEKEFSHLRGEKLFSWIQEYAKSCGTSISKLCSQDICLADGDDTALLAHEIQKCALCFPNEKITKERLASVSSYSPEFTYFNWLQGVFENNWKTKAITLEFDDGEAAQRLAGLINAVRIVLVSRSQPCAERAVFMKNVNPYWLRNLEQWSTNISEQTLEQWFASLVQYDMWALSHRISKQEALERFVFSI